MNTDQFNRFVKNVPKTKKEEATYKVSLSYKRLNGTGERSIEVFFNSPHLLLEWVDAFPRERLVDEIEVHFLKDNYV